MRGTGNRNDAVPLIASTSNISISWSEHPVSPTPVIFWLILKDRLPDDAIEPISNVPQYLPLAGRQSLILRINRRQTHDDPSIMAAAAAGKIDRRRWLSLHRDGDPARTLPVF